MFLHWLVGILCAFYFASFVLLLREVLRPGVLWFLRNLNDPDFNPVQEVIFKSKLKKTALNGSLTYCSFSCLLDDPSTNCPSFEAVRCFTCNFRNNCFFDALGSYSTFAKGHAAIFALLHR